MDSAVVEIIDTIKQEQDPFAKAKLILTLQKDHKVPIKKISEELGLKPAYVCHILRLNRVPPFVVDGYYTDSVSISHLFVVSRLKDQESMEKVYERILAENLTVAQLEEVVREALYSVKEGSGDYLEKGEKEILEDILAKNKVKVKITQTRIKGKILLEVKGGLAQTTPTLRKLITTLTS